MPVFDIGRLCMKTQGRDAGRRCVVVDLIDKNYVLVTGPKQVTGVRRRRVNVNHLVPLDERINIEKGAIDDKIVSLLK